MRVKIVDDKEKDARLDVTEREEINYEGKKHSDLPQPVRDILQIFQGEIKGEVSIKKEDTKKSG